MGRDVLWLTLESVRQDHTSLGGHRRNTTPGLEALASGSDATAFSRCFSHDIWTRPSTASILTGRASSAHQTWAMDRALPSRIPTVPEAFAAAGYRTVGISPNAQFSDATNLSRGFDQFHYLTKDRLLEEAGVGVLLRYLANIRRHGAGLTLDGRKQPTGYIQNRLAKRHVREAAEHDDDLFLYLHYGDSHHAYYPPVAWQRRFEDDLPLSLDEALATALDMSRNLHEHIAAGVPFSDDELTALRTLYDTCIAYVDSLVADLCSTARTVLDDPIIVVTADHGELFGEHGGLAHMLVATDPLSHVPLVVAGIDGLDSYSDAIVQHADAMGMVAAECGVDAELPLARDIHTNPSVAVTQRSGERAATKLERLLEHNPEFPIDRYHEGTLNSLRTADYRYQSSDSGEELLALPDETTDVSATDSDTAATLAADLESWLARNGQPTGESSRAEFDEDMESQLRDLGYLS